jgi:hypothetical protein
MFKPIKAWRSLAEATRAVIVALAFVVATAIAVNLHGKSKADRWMACLENAGCNGSVAPSGTEAPVPPAKPTIQAIYTVAPEPPNVKELAYRVNAQLDEIRRRSDYHLRVTRDFYVNYYYAVTMGLVLGSIAAVLLFFVSQKGWKDAEQWQIASFIVITTAAAVFGAFPLLYSQQDNIEQNKELYLHHKALEQEILSFAVTGEPNDRAKLGIQDERDIPPAVFVRYVDRRMSEFHKLPLGFDYTRLPVDYLAGVPAEVRPAPPQNAAPRQQQLPPQRQSREPKPSAPGNSSR